MYKIVACILILVGFNTNGQNVLSIISSDSTVYKNKFVPISNGTNYNKELEKTQYELFNNGFLTSNFDSVRITQDTAYAFLFIGHQYKLARLQNNNVDEEILASSGFREKLFLNKPLNINQIKKLFERVLVGYEQNGYPFARVKMDVDSVQENAISGRLTVIPHQQFVIDSIYIKSESPLSRKYITNSIRISQGDLYNQKLLDAISTRVKEISFITEIRPAELVFKDGEADLYLYLKKRVANRFNGVIGFLPDNQTGKLTVTGEVNLDLVNAFNAGEEIHLSWRKLQTFTQELNANAHYPFLFGLPLGIGGAIGIYKRDSTYLEVSPELEVRYQLEGRNHFSVFYNSYQSTLLDPERFANATSLPAFNDANRTMFGVQIFLRNLDYRINPRQGYFIDIKASTGSKQIKKLDELDPELYENVNLRTRQHQISGHVGHYLPLLKRTTLYTALRGAWLINENVFVNEMIRLGGISSLRGFDDQSILASAFAIGTIEYRFLLEQNSYLYAFMDYGYYENKSPEIFIHNQPMGIGAGISFETKPGIFTINYALGKLKDTTFLLRAGKIHFGFVNYF